MLTHISHRYDTKKIETRETKATNQSNQSNKQTKRGKLCYRFQRTNTHNVSQLSKSYDIPTAGGDNSRSRPGWISMNTNA